ncbi:putative membrane-anchored protein [Acidovorax sp. 56]|uniref:GDYXXLXY domain-containing protein n=1 Tax=Acidovorax sp. 56 TaxID=2035205 RepID=UPI000C43BA81|nr:GDYXXLXY domain-containing protein [Acidovorax sp. 56]PIF26840.1 putative membrane-anchored protein [Acidovorax sp. 56]
MSQTAMPHTDNTQADNDLPGSPLEKMLHSAQALGLLPANAQPPADPGRPWPVVLLTLLGAWLAALPVLAIFALFAGRWLLDGAGTYVVGTLALAGAVALLRAQGLALFLEQIAIPALFTGGWLLGFALVRDGPHLLAAATLLLITLAVAAAVPQHWLRTLLGGAAAGLWAWTVGGSWHHLHRSIDVTILWGALHVALLTWVGLLALQHQALGQHNRLAVALEPLACGWVVAVLCGLAQLSGMTFMLAGVLGSSGGLWEPASHTTGSGASSLVSVNQVGSVALVLAAGWVAQRAWPALRQPQAAALLLVLAVLGFFMPTLGAALLALAITGTTQRWRQAAVAALAAAWMVGSFYYQLAWPLATKAMVLAGCGAVLGLLAWTALRTAQHTATAQPADSTAPAAQAAGAIGAIGAAPRIATWALVLGLACTLLVANVGIAQKEHTIAQGRKVFVPLAPVDPRSLMQGDYMRLNFQLPAERITYEELAWGQRPHAVGTLDERGVVQWLRIDLAEAPLQAGEMRFALTPRDGQWTLVTDAWYFREGDAARWEAAKFGEFRVEPDGKALLVGLADAQLRGIAP